MATRLTFEKRAELTTHPLLKKLFKLMADKQSNLALSADVTTKRELLAIADLLGPEICVLKTHIDIIEDFDQDLVVQLRQLADKHQFLIFEDRKFADIGHTVQLQYAKGIYHIAEWADIINAHCLPGPGIIEGLSQIGLPKGRGLLLLAEMSSAGNLFTQNYIEKVLNFAKQYPEFVIGFISQHCFAEDPNWIYMTPGVKLKPGSDKLGQQYRSPSQAIVDQGCDVIIVGRDILSASNPLTLAKCYRETAWKTYLDLILAKV
ncbi:MAG: orotidine-5'-phosphate decarboxylase [Gammaproteobacteria bacterium]|nr:orotidine-5'-phosphate decarboxylase [Gammaproteobacteria bacterium]